MTANPAVGANPPTAVNVHTNTDGNCSNYVCVAQNETDFYYIGNAYIPNNLYLTLSGLAMSCDGSYAMNRSVIGTVPIGQQWYTYDFNTGISAMCSMNGCDFAFDVLCDTSSHNPTYTLLMYTSPAGMNSWTLTGTVFSTAQECNPLMWIFDYRSVASGGFGTDCNGNPVYGRGIVTE